MATGMAARRVGVRGTRYFPTSWQLGLREIFLANGQPPNRFSNGSEDGVADGWRNRRSAGFAAAAGRLITWHDVNFDGGHFIQAQHFVIIEIALFDAAFGNGDLSFQRCRESVDNPAFHLGRGGVGIDVAAAVHSADDAMNLYVTGVFVKADFRNLRDKAAEGFGNCNAACLSRRKWLSPPCLLCSQFQHTAMAWRLFQQLSPEFERVFAARARQFFDEALGDVAVLRISDGAPKSNRNSRFRQDIIAKEIRNGVLALDDSFDRAVVQPILYRAREKTRHDGWANDAALPRYRPAIRVKAARQFRISRRPIEIMLHIVFAGPGDLNRSADRFLNFHGLGDKILFRAAAKSTTEISSVNAHLLGLQTSDLCAGVLIGGLKLVGAEMSQPSARTSATQFMGSMLAWARNGTS
jgi:hypothetical protein